MIKARFLIIKGYEPENAKILTKSRLMNRISSISLKMQASYLAYLCSLGYIVLITLMLTVNVQASSSYQNKMVPSMEVTVYMNGEENPSSFGKGEQARAGVSIVNTGSTILQMVNITDSQIAGADLRIQEITGDSNQNGLIDPLESWTVYYMTTIQASATHLITVSANPVDENRESIPGLDTITANDSIEVLVLSADIQLIKGIVGAESQTIYEVLRGESVEFEYFIKNTGSTDLASITLIDNPHGNILIQGNLENGTFLGGDEDTDGILDQSETWQFTLIVENYQEDITSIGVVNANPVLVNGSDIDGLENPTDSDITTVVVVESATVEGFVLEDQDGDDAGDAGLAGIAVYIVDASNNEQESFTAQDGKFSFTGVAEGPYALTIGGFDSYIPVTDSDGTNPILIQNTISSGEVDDSNFFVLSRMSQTVSGFVMADVDGDDIGDFGMGNVTITVEIDDNTLSTTTDETGLYQFEIPIGKFEIREEDPEGYASIKDAQGKNNNKIKGEVAFNENITDLNFVDAKFAQVAGRVMADMDENGSEDQPLANAIIYLIDRDDDRQTVTTNEDGSFWFEVAPGPFTIIEKDPAGFRSLSDVDGANDNVITGRALPDQLCDNKNFFDAFLFADCIFDPPTITIVDNVCEPVTSGSISLDGDCAPLATTEFSTDNGNTWSTTVPTYDPVNSVSFLARCVENDPACINEGFDFESLDGSDDPVTDITNAGLTANGITLTSLTVVNNGTAQQDDFEINDSHVAGTFGPQFGVTMGDGVANNQTATYTFSAPISDFCVQINDLDQNDAVIVNGSLGGGAPIQLTTNDFMFPFGVGTCPEFEGNNTFESKCFGNVGNVSNSLQGAVVVCFPTPVDQVEFLFYDWNGSGGGSYTVSTFEICIPQEPCISDTLSFATNPMICCMQPAAPLIDVVDNTCDPDVAGSFIVVTDCPAGSDLEFSTDGGLTFSPTMPTYPSLGNTIVARCVDTAMGDCISENSNAVTATPVQCCEEPDAPVIGVIDNTCDPDIAGNFIVITDCPAGTDLEYSIDNGTTFSTAVPIYPSLGITVIARCVDPSIANCSSVNSTGVIANPIQCCEEPDAPVLGVNDNTCDPDIAGDFIIITDCPATAVIEFSIDNGITWTTVMPAYPSLGNTVLARCADSVVADCFSVPSTAVTANPIDCCTVPSAPELSVADSACDPLTTGTFLVTTDCPAGTAIEYSTDGGLNWVPTLPEYPADGQEVIARCVDNSVANCFSAASVPITANPEECTPCIDIIKTSSLDLGADGVANPGDIIDYSYTVTNCGNIVLENIGVNEFQMAFTGSGTLPVPTALSSFDLSPGSSGTATAPYILTQNDINTGLVINQAVATGTDPFGEEVMDDSDSGNPIDQDMDPDTPTTTPIPTSSCIEILKTASFDEGADGETNLGDVITYNYVITNCGNTTLSSIQLIESADSFTGTGNLPIPQTPSPLIINPGEQSMSTATYVITQEDIDAGGVTNQAVVTADDPRSNEVTDDSDSDDPLLAGPDDPTITPLDQNPCLELIKTSELVAAIDGLPLPGDQILYSYILSNCGNVTITDIAIQELNDSFTGTNGLPQVSAVMPTSLTPGESATAEAIYTISQEDINAGSVSNQALAVGTDPTGEDVEDESDSDDPVMDGPDDPTITPIPQVTCIDLIKSSSFDQGINAGADIGDVINYTYVVSNCGNVLLTDVIVTEDDNVFTGTNPLPIIENIPNLNLNPGESSTLNASYQISQQDIDSGGVDNQALVTGTEPDGETIFDVSDSGNPVDDTGSPEDPTTTMLPATPCVELIKSSSFDIGDNGASDSGDLITYTYVIRNCGQLTLTNISLQESVASFSGTGALPNPTTVNPGTLAPGEEGFATALYAVTQADINSELVINQAVVLADPPFGDQVMDDSDSGNPFDEEGTPQDPTTTPIGNCNVLACNQNVQISLDETCSLRVRPDQLLENPQENGAFSIAFNDSDNNFIRNDSLFSSDVGETINYQVFCGGNSCWGTLTVEVNVIPEITAPCACQEDGSIPPDCVFWCGADISSSLLTQVEVLEIFDECGPQMIGGIVATETTTGELCDELGEIREIVYSAKILRHGLLEEIEILCQRYAVQKLDIDVSEEEFSQTFGFPRNVKLDCNYLDDIDSEVSFDFASPESIFAATGSGSLAYAFFVDKHTLVDLVRIDTVIEHVVVDTVIREDVIKQDIDGDGQLEWVLAQIVDKITEEQIVFDTVVIGQTNPEVPLIDRVCNIQASYSDFTFNVCGGGVKITRDWTIIDWCDSSVRRTGTQNIEILDRTAPIVRDADGNSVTNLSDVFKIIDPWECRSNIRLPELTVEDDCSTEIEIEWITPDFIIEDGFILDVSPGDSPVLIEGVVKDDCDNETIVNFTIIVKDEIPPSLVCESAASVFLTLDPNTGEAVGKLPATHFDAGSTDLSCGKIFYHVVREEDWVQQVTNCNGESVGFLPVTCGVEVDTLSFESKDCPDETVFISRPSEFVKFCCEDIGKDLAVILIVSDESGNRNTCRVPVTVTNSATPIIVCQDQTVDCSVGDEIELPRMIVESCIEDQYNIELLSEAANEGVCNGGSIIREWYVDVDNNNELSDGDAYCRQRLLIENGEGFDPTTIQWPPHYDGSAHDGVHLSCDDDGGTIETPGSIAMEEAMSCFPDDTEAKPIWCESSCNLIGYTMELDTINVDFACSKVIRTWTIIDWCTYNPNGIESSDGDVFEAVHTIEAADCIDCVNDLGEFHETHWRYTDVVKDGHYNFEQIIYIQDDSAPEIDVVESFTSLIDTEIEDKDDFITCGALVSVTATGIDFCDNAMTSANNLNWSVTIFAGDEIDSTAQLRGRTATIEFEALQGIEYTINWFLGDGCGNSIQAATTVSVIDDVAPTPFCLFGATTTIRIDQGNVEIWAADLNFGSFDNCTPREDLRFTVVPLGEIPINPTEEGFEEQQVINFSCDEFSSFNELHLWVWDTSNNGSFCQTSLTLDDRNICDVEDSDPMPVDTMVVDTVTVDTMMIDTMNVDTMSVDTTAIASGLTIGGDIYTYYNDPIDQVLVTIDGQLSEYPKQTTTLGEGNYAFGNNPDGYNYSITPERTDDVANGVTTIDLVMMSRHIIGLEVFESPYQIIAADVSNDQRVSAADLSELKRVILGTTAEFRNNDSWVFVVEEFQFFDVSNPWPFTDNINIQDLASHMTHEDFIGVKIGDVTESVTANRFANTETRSNKEFALNIYNRYIEKGEKFGIPIYSSKDISTVGIQMELEYDGLTITNINSGKLHVDDEDMHVTDESARLVWYKESPVDLSDSEELIVLQVTAERSGYLSDLINISSSYFSSELYEGDQFEANKLQLKFVDDQNQYTDMYNAPNPFVENTTVYFQAQKSGTVFARVNDSSGRLLWSSDITVSVGQNQLTITGDNFDSEGFLFFTLMDGNQAETIKLLHLKR